jgi:hypothetical protein
MFSILVLCAAIGGDADFDMIGQRLAAHDMAIAELRADLFGTKAELAALKAKCNCANANAVVATPPPRLTTQPVGYVAVTKATEVHHPGLLNVAGAVATAPLKAVTRTVCGGNSCRQVTEWVPDTPAETTFDQPQTWSQPAMQEQPVMQFKQRGFFKGRQKCGKGGCG